MNRRGFFGRLLGGVAVALGAKLAPKAYEALVEVGPSVETQAAAGIAAVAPHVDPVMERRLAAYRKLEADLQQHPEMLPWPPVIYRQGAAYQRELSKAQRNINWIPYDGHEPPQLQPLTPFASFEDRYPELRQVIEQRDEMNRLILKHINARIPAPIVVPRAAHLRNYDWAYRSAHEDD